MNRLQFTALANRAIKIEKNKIQKKAQKNGLSAMRVSRRFD